MEVEYQAEFDLCESEVGDQLSLVDRHDSIHALEFDNHRIFNNNVHSITAIKTDSFVAHLYWNLSLKMQPTELQLETGTLRMPIRAGRDRVL